MASETYCMECVEGRPVALGLCADCWAGEPLEEVIRQIARLSSELEAAREIIRDLVDREPICVALRSKYVEVRIDGGTWDDARRFVGLDPAGDDETM